MKYIVNSVVDIQYNVELLPGIPCKEGIFPINMLNSGIEVERYSTDGSSLFGACGQCGYINNKG